MAWDNSGNGATVATSKQCSATILFAKTGQTIIRQLQTQERTEYRGLTETRAKAMCVDTAFSNYAETTYYKAIDGEAYSFTAVSGTKTEWSAARTDESGQWVATCDVTTYSVSPAPTSYGWGTTQIDGSGNSTALTTSGTEYQTGFDKSYSYVYSLSGNTLYSVTTTTTKEYRRIDTAAHAAAKVNSLSASSLAYTSLTCDCTTVRTTLQVLTGTETTASSSFVSAAEGYTVIATTVTHSYANASGNTHDWSAT